jgi:hypothetical protein
MLMQTQLDDTVGAFSTLDASTTVKIKTLIFFNSGASANSIDIHIVKNSGGSVGTASGSNQILRFSLPSGDTFEFSPSFPIVLNEENDTLQGVATTADEVNVFVMGVSE